jgi:hypothetical protein
VSRNVASWGLIIPGILFLELGIASAARRLVAVLGGPAPAPEPPQPLEGFAAVLNAFATLVVSLTGVQLYYSSTILGFLLVLAGVLIGGERFLEERSVHTATEEVRIQHTPTSGAALN